MLIKNWIDDWQPEVIEDTGHYVRIQMKCRVTIREAAYFCERLLSLGYRFIAGHDDIIVCEKL